MNNKAFHNLFCNPQKSFHTSPGYSDLYREAVDQTSNLTAAITENVTTRRKLSVIAIDEFEEWLTVSIIRVGRSRRGVKTLVVYKKITELITDPSFVI